MGNEGALGTLGWPSEGFAVSQVGLQGNIVVCLSVFFLAFWESSGTKSTDWTMCLVCADWQAEMQREDVWVWVYVWCIRAGCVRALCVCACMFVCM